MRPNDLAVLTLAALAIGLVSIRCPVRCATAADPAHITPTERGVAGAADERAVRKEESRPVWERKRVWERKLDDGTSLVVDASESKGTPYNYTWRIVTDGKQDESGLFCVATTECVGLIPRERFPVTVLDAGLTPHGDLMTVYNQRGKCWGVIVARRPTDQEMPERFDFSPAEKLNNGQLVGPPLKSAKMELDPDGLFRITGEDEDGTSRQYELRHWTYFQRIVYFWKPIDETEAKP
jgi:hypothetical protein